MAYEDEHIAALHGMATVLRNILVQMRQDAVAKKLHNAQLLATLRRLQPPKETL